MLPLTLGGLFGNLVGARFGIRLCGEVSVAESIKGSESLPYAGCFDLFALAISKLGLRGLEAGRLTLCAFHCVKR